MGAAASFSDTDLLSVGIEPCSILSYRLQDQLLVLFRWPLSNVELHLADTSCSWPLTLVETCWREGLRSVTAVVGDVLWLLQRTSSWPRPG